MREPRWAVVPVSTGTTVTEPVSVSECRTHLRGSTADTDDTLIGNKITAARIAIEGRTQRSCLINQFDQVLDGFPGDQAPIPLRRSPLVSVESVTWYGTTGGATVLSTGAYFLDPYSQPGRLCLQSGYSWPLGTRDQVAGVIRFSAGYSTSPGGVPDPMTEAIAKLATELYENREAVNVGSLVQELPLGIEALLADYLMPEIF